MGERREWGVGWVWFTMCVLGTVFTHAWEVTLDVARVVFSLIEGRSQQHDQLALIVNKVFIQRLQHLIPLLGISCTRNDTP